MTDATIPAPSALDVLSLRMTADRVRTDEAYKAWEDASALYLANVEALPLAPDNVPARLRALRVLYGDDLAELDAFLASSQSGDARLVRQIITTLLRAG